MRRGRLRTGLRIAVSTAIGLSLALTANDPTLAQPSPRQTTPARSPADAPSANDPTLAQPQPSQTAPARSPADASPYPLEGDTVSEPPSAPATAHAVACSESFGKDSNHLKLAMGFGFKNVTTTDVVAENGTKVAASVLFPDDPQQRLEVWWTNAASHSGIYLIVIGGKSDWTAPGGLRLGLTLAELEKLNHKSFKLKGFDKNGIATGKDWDGGELASLAGGCNAGLSLRADPKVSAKIIGALSPNKEYASSNPQMRAAKPTVSEILIGYPTDALATEAARQPVTRQRASEDCWMETEQGAKGLSLEKRAKLVDKCVKDKMSGAKTTDAPATEAAPKSSSPPASEAAPQSSSAPAAEATPQSSSVPARPRPFGPSW
jgi:hypothetical protein